MPLYSLSSHCCDVSLNSSLKDNSIQRINKLFLNDTMGIRDDIVDLQKLQDDSFQDPINILKSQFGITLDTSSDLFNQQTPQNLNSFIEVYSELSLVKLTCLEMMSSLLKSSGLGLLALHDWISIRDALKLSRLEERYQTALYGQIEEFHVFDEVNILMNSLATKIIWDLND